MPTTTKGRIYEIRALGLRDFAGLRTPKDALNPFDLARYAKLFVVPFDKVQETLSPETVKHLLGDGKNAWSGGTCSQNLPNGWRLIILNPTHGAARQNSTLMEEVCHVFLGHKPSRLAVKTRNKRGEEIARDYNEADEEAAYSVGAAALVPFVALRDFIKQDKTSRQIAVYFNVSRELVEYRMKISFLWKSYLEKVKGNDAEYIDD